MAVLLTKDFIETVFISELGQVAQSFPYLAFMNIGIGVEFLGKCIDTGEEDWNRPQNSARHFKKAINELSGFERYRCYLDSHDLYVSFRCGLAHAAAPNFGVTLSSGDEIGNLVLRNNRLNLKIEDLFEDFKLACREVIAKTFPVADKMNRPYLNVPDRPILPNAFTVTGATQ